MNKVLDFSWVIVCIRGRAGFQELVLPKLRERYLTGDLETDHVVMVWVADVKKIRRLKLAIGSSIIFKYRLHFVTSAPHLKKDPSAGLYLVENEMVNQIKAACNKNLEPPEVVVEDQTPVRYFMHQPFHCPK